MTCEFNYCIYNKNFFCLLDNVRINALAQCDECIMVSLPQDELLEYKNIQLQKIMSKDDY